MANNYIQFSFIVSATAPEQKDWWVKVLELLNDTDGLNALQDATTVDAWKELGIAEEEIPEWVPCSVGIESDGIYLYTDESGDPEVTAALVRCFLAKFGLPGMVTFEVALYSSKPRPGEFGGVAYAITAESVEGYGTSNWVYVREREHAAANSKEGTTS